ncbi:MAG TPA: transposase [Ktedonobacterales bacterium]|jgi:putative transposase
MPGRTFSRDFKLEVVRQLAEGHKRPAQVCREYQLADSVLAHWRKEYEERGEAAFTPKEGRQPSGFEARVAELERFCGQLALENAA